MHSFKEAIELSPGLGTNTLTVHMYTHTHKHCHKEEPSKVTENPFTSKINTDAKWLDKLNEAGKINSLNKSLRNQMAQKP